MADEKVTEKVNELTIDASNAAEEDDFVDPWTVASKSDKGIDYDKLIRKLLLNMMELKYNSGLLRPLWEQQDRRCAVSQDRKSNWQASPSFPSPRHLFLAS